MFIRKFSAEDHDTFLTLCKDFYNSNATINSFNEKTARMTFDRVVDEHENLWGFMLIGAEDNRPFGYALITSYWCNEEGGNVIVLDELYIGPGERHKGYATKFMDWLMEYYKDTACSVTLEVLTTNSSACALYSKEGFEPDGFTTYTKKI